MCAGNCSGDCSCAPEIPRGPRGLQGPMGRAATISVGTVTSLPAGSTPTVVNSGSDTVAILDFGLTVGDTGPAGPDGQDATELYTSLTNAFIIPALNSGTTATVGNTSWMRVGSWVRMADGSNSGAYLYIGAVPSATTVFLVNRGSTAGWPNGVALQPAPGTTVSPDATQTQIMHAAVPGLPGEDGETGPTGPTGPAGISALVPFVNTVPVSAPVPGQETQIYQNDPSTPTIMRFYYYSGGVWSGSGNFVGAAGTQTVTTPGNPNATLPAGPIGTLAFRTDVPSLWLKTGASTWTLQFSIAPTFQQVATTSGGDFGTVAVSTQAVIGFVPDAATHTSPGTFTFDLAFQSQIVEADKDIELDFDDSTYTESAQWVWQVTNVDASPIATTYAAGRFTKKTGLSLPATLAAGATQVYICYKQDTQVLISDTYVSVAV